MKLTSTLTRIDYVVIDTFLRNKYKRSLVKSFKKSMNSINIKKTTDFTTDNENSYTYTSFHGVLMVLEFHHNKLFDI